MPDRTPLRARSVLAALRIRKKLIVLHTLFSAVLAVTLLLALQPAIRDLVAATEEHECRLTQDLLRAGRAPDRFAMDGVWIDAGSANALGLTLAEQETIATTGEFVSSSWAQGSRIVRRTVDGSRYVSVTARSTEARASVLRIYMLMAVSLLAVYALIALSLEVFVLPRQVYQPIRRLLEADEAIRQGNRAGGIIPERDMPADELGQIMRSRNTAIEQLHAKEAALEDALERLEIIATDMKRKNFLLEATRRNMADQDRLASLGMMSAGLAHEMNTPLAVLKGSVERLAEAPNKGVDEEQAALMLRVVSRLERLSESLLDFARVRPPRRNPVDVRAVVSEAWTLVRLDREAHNVTLENQIQVEASVLGDADRLTQVFVNVLRNAADALPRDGRITVSSATTEREGRPWLSVLCVDDGPGIDPAVLPRLFEPFTSTRLDSRGTGLGLAVAEGIVREHGGTILARNDPDGGAVFEIMLPVEPLADEPLVADDGADTSGAESSA